jgi:hypothetical protein
MIDLPDLIRYNVNIPDIIGQYKKGATYDKRIHNDRII